jgi:hypothetical protein
MYATLSSVALGVVDSAPGGRNFSALPILGADAA